MRRLRLILAIVPALALAACAASPARPPAAVAAPSANPPAETGAEEPGEALPDGINPITREVEQRALAP